MSRYYYFAATLPALQFGAPAPMSTQEYLDRCQRNLDSRDFALIEAVCINSASDEPPKMMRNSTLLMGYYGWERSTRNELVRLRARKLGRNADTYIRSADSTGRVLVDDDASRSALVSFQAESPLDGELALERERWSKLESLCALHAFDIDCLLAYRLELLILERLARLRSETGEVRYKETYAAILGAAQSTEKTGVPQ